MSVMRKARYSFRSDVAPAKVYEYYWSKVHMLGKSKAYKSYSRANKYHSSVTNTSMRVI